MAATTQTAHSRRGERLLLRHLRGLGADERPRTGRRLEQLIDQKLASLLLRALSGDHRQR
jgi:hypothetical protein